MNYYLLYKQAYEELQTKGKSHELTSEDSQYILDKYNYDSQERQGRLALDLAIDDIAKKRDLRKFLLKK